MQTLWKTTLTPDDRKVARHLAEQVVTHYEHLKKHGYQRYDTAKDSREREKAIRQNLCGIFAEMGVCDYLLSVGVGFRANIKGLLQSFDQSQLTAPDFQVEWPRGSGNWRELEVKSNQSHWGCAFFRMLIPRHWHGYGRANSLVLWTSVDVDELTVSVHGFNYASLDMSPSQMIAKTTCVPNFQLRADVPVRDLATETEDSEADANRGFPLLKNGLWTVRQNGVEHAVSNA